MSLSDIKALTFNTGGTVLDWHTGFREAFETAGRRHGIDRNWSHVANQFRRLSMEMMLNLGGDGLTGYNFDEAHALCLEKLLQEEGLDAFDDADRHRIAWEAPHHLTAWPDVRKQTDASIVPLLYCALISLPLPDGRTGGSSDSAGGRITTSG